MNSPVFLMKTFGERAEITGDVMAEDDRHVGKFVALHDEDCLLYYYDDDDGAMFIGKGLHRLCLLIASRGQHMQNVHSSLDTPTLLRLLDQ